jgi:outer membrane lipoprotein-sorting protein
VSELGDLLELIYGAGDRWRSVRLTMREWQHSGRAREAIERLHSRQASGGRVSSMMFAGDASEPEPEEHEHIVRIWLDGDRAREEREGPYAFPTLGIRVGAQWWMYSPEYGATTNEGDPDNRSGVGEQALGLLEPTHVLGALRLEPAGDVEAAGRPALLVRARPRNRDAEGAFMLFRLGPGADEYELVFDRERGVLLRTTSFLDNLPLTTIEVVEIAFDEEFPPETFRFELPEGETFRPLFPQHEHVTLERAAELAPFAVLSPAEVPNDWQLHVLYQPGEERPPLPASVTLHYHSHDASQQLQIAQTALVETDQYDWLEWEESGGVLLAGPAEPHGLEPGYVRVERDGTRATLSSATLPRERLVAFARSLEPAYPAG